MTDRPPRSRDAVLARAQRGGRLPSVVAGVVEDGRLAWVGSVGSDVGPQAGDPADTQYRIGSITKTLTAVLLLQARDEGLVDLLAPLSAYVPEAPYGDRSLRALLSHTAGLPAEPSGPWWERHDGGPFAALVVADTGTAPMAGPGAEFRYSNLAYGLLGEAVSRVRGQGWWDLVSVRILEPLGMTRTTYQAAPPHAQGWSVSHLLNTLTPEPFSDTGAMAPAGQAWSTVTDLATYAAFVLHGHPGVLSLETLVEASTPVAEGGGEYGLGFQRQETSSGVLVGHTGSMPGFRASFFCHRAEDRACVALSNATIGQDSARLAVDVLEATGTAPATTAPWQSSREVPAEVGSLVGVWYWGETQYEIRWDGVELEMVASRGEDAEQRYGLLEGRWIGTDRTELEVVRTVDGSVDHLVNQTYRFTRTPYAAEPPITAPR